MGPAGSASFISGNKVASGSRLGRWWVMGEVKGGTHRQACPTEASGRGCSAVPGLCPPVPSTRGQSARVGKAGEPGPGPHDPTLSSLHSSSLGLSHPLSTDSQRSRQRATSFLLTLTPGPMDSRLGASRETEVGRDQGARGQDTQSKCPKLCPPAASAFFSGASLALAAFPFAFWEPARE